MQLVIREQLTRVLAQLQLKLPYRTVIQLYALPEHFESLLN